MTEKRNKSARHPNFTDKELVDSITKQVWKQIQEQRMGFNPGDTINFTIGF